MPRPHLVVAIAYDRLCTFEFGCVVELFALPRPELDVRWYEFAVCAAERGPLRAAGGITVTAPNSLKLLDRADTIIMPGWRDANEPPPPELLQRIRAARDRGARLCSICSGVFVLAAAGVLDGKRVTTHWRYAELLGQRYPSVRVEPNALYIDQGQVLTSAGSAAGLDMLLHLVRRDHGPKVANQVAQRLVIPPHRDGDQAQYVPRPVAPAVAAAGLDSWPSRRRAFDRLVVTPRRHEPAHAPAALQGSDRARPQRVAGARACRGGARDARVRTGRTRPGRRAGGVRFAGIVPAAFPPAGRRRARRVPQAVSRRRSGFSPTLAGLKSDLQALITSQG